MLPPSRKSKKFKTNHLLLERVALFTQTGTVREVRERKSIGQGAISKRCSTNSFALRLFRLCGRVVLEARTHA
jgi:hypothetical protein